jgi:3-hydroxybutyryl-CoA dehydrogenase
MKIQHIFVVGAGTMGHGIAQTAAAAGYQTTLMDIDQNQLDQARDSIKKSVEKLHQKERISAEQLESALKIVFSTDLNGVESADLIIEAVAENFQVKREVFQKLDQKASKQSILASNTSSISLTRLGALTGRPDRVIGMHFMNPVPLMKLVEIISGLDTSQETVQLVRATAENMGKEPVESADFPGFISNRILCPMINEAIFALQEGVGTKEAIDRVMVLGMNHPMGPLTLADLIGLDVVLAVMEVLQEDLGEDKYRPAYLLRKMVAAGHLGRKSGRGFYQY